MRIGVIIPTKDRPDELARLLGSLCRQTRLPDQVVIIEAGTRTPSLDVCSIVPDGLAVRVLPFSPPSAARQRNAGLDVLPEEIDVAALIDDDMVLAADAIESMLRFWSAAPRDVLGACFNIVDVAPTPGTRWKRSGWATALGLYERHAGGVAPSGWQTAFTTADENADARWLPSGAVCWRRPVVAKERYDRFFDGYSYLEDLEHSYRIGRRGRLVVVADARCEHLPGAGGRPAGFPFGRMEAVNRAFFVQKHRLSFGRYAVAMTLRALVTLGVGLRHGSRARLARFAGNAVGLIDVLVRGRVRRVADARRRAAR